MARLSTYPVAGVMANADIAFGLVAGADEQIPRSVLLTGAPGEPIALVNGGSALAVGSGGDIELFAVPGVTLRLRANATFVFDVSAAGQVDVQPIAGQTLSLLANGAMVQLDTIGGIIITPLAGQVVTMGYTPAFPGDWVVPPTDLLIAVDRIARVVSALGTAPIP